MNQELSQLFVSTERKVDALRAVMEELEKFGGNPPTETLKNYDLMRAETLRLDIEITQLLPPKKGEEKRILEAMQRLEMLVNSVQTYAEIIEGEVKQAKRNFYDQCTQIVGEIEKGEARAYEQILACFRDLAKSLRIRWNLTEKKFRLSQYITMLGNEFTTAGVTSPPASIIYLPWAEKIPPIESKFQEAFLSHFLAKIALGDNLTTETFKQK